MIIVLNDRSITFCTSFVSKYSHINASKDVRGIDTIIAAAHVYFFAISETITTIKAVRNVFIKKYIIIK